MIAEIKFNLQYQNSHWKTRKIHRVLAKRKAHFLAFHYQNKLTEDKMIPKIYIFEENTTISLDIIVELIIICKFNIVSFL